MIPTCLHPCLRGEEERLLLSSSPHYVKENSLHTHADLPHPPRPPKPKLLFEPFSFHVIFSLRRRPLNFFLHYRYHHLTNLTMLIPRSNHHCAPNSNHHHGGMSSSSFSSSSFQYHQLDLRVKHEPPPRRRKKNNRNAISHCDSHFLISFHSLFPVRRWVDCGQRLRF